MQCDRRLTLALMLLAFTLPEAQGAAASEVQRFAILTTAMEAALATTSLAEERSPGSLRDIGWYLRYSDRNWDLEVKGSDLRYQLHGYLWGEDNSDWLVTFAGTGDTKKEQMSINGKAEWLYERISSDHLAMNFYNGIKFGQNSGWGWVVGSELIIGASIGGGVAFSGTVLTGPGAVFGVF